MANLKLWHYLLIGLFILCIVFARLAFNKESQGVYTPEQLQLMTELDSINTQLLTLKEKKKLVIATLWEENLTEKLLNPSKYYECTYDGCTSLLASGAGINPTTWTISE